MVRSRAMWMEEMGLTGKDEAYESRKNDMLVHIRSQWTKREHLHSGSREDHRQLKEWIRPLVEQYPTQGESFELRLSKEQRLLFYTSWAFAVNSWSREEKRGKNYQGFQADNEVETTGQSAPTDEPEPLDATLEPEAHESTRNSDRQDASQPQPTMLMPNTGIPTPASQERSSLTTTRLPSTPFSFNPATTAIDWDTIEVAIDARIVGLGTVWFPMIDLKPDTTDPCHWKDFDVNKLREHIEADTEKKIDMDVHNLVYTGPGYVGLTVNTRGSYKIALKWFVERGVGRGKIFHLRVEAKDGTSGPGDGQRVKMHGSTLSLREKVKQDEV